MSYDSNLYYNPEDHGLEIVSSVDVGDSYEFDMTVIFRDVETGALMIGSDSGCSCPTPFEDQTRDNLTPIKGKVDAIDYVRDSYGWDDGPIADLVSGW